MYPCSASAGRYFRADVRLFFSSWFEPDALECDMNTTSAHGPKGHEISAINSVTINLGSL